MANYVDMTFFSGSYGKFPLSTSCFSNILSTPFLSVMLRLNINVRNSCQYNAFRFNNRTNYSFQNGQLIQHLSRIVSTKTENIITFYEGKMYRCGYEIGKNPRHAVFGSSIPSNGVFDTCNFISSYIGIASLTHSQRLLHRKANITRCVQFMLRNNINGNWNWCGELNQL